MQTIFVPVDFTMTSYISAFFALHLAQTTKTKILFYHSFNIPVISQEFYVNPNIISEIEKVNKNQLSQFIEEVISAAPETLNTEISGEVSPGYLQNLLPDLIATREIDFIIMAKHHFTSDIQKILTGSQTLSTIRQSEIPVFVIPDHCAFKEIKKIGFATSLDDIDDAGILLPLLQFTGKPNVEIHLTVVVPDGVAEHSQEQLNEYIMLENLFQNFTHKLVVIESHDIANALIHYMDQNHIDLVVTMPKKHSFMEILFHKSITENLLNQTKIPILCLL